MQKELRLERIIPGSAKWEPKEDITAWEVAQALPVLHMSSQPNWGHTTANMLASLPTTVKRHFTYRLEPHEG